MISSLLLIFAPLFPLLPSHVSHPLAEPHGACLTRHSRRCPCAAPSLQIAVACTAHSLQSLIDCILARVPTLPLTQRPCCHPSLFLYQHLQPPHRSTVNSQSAFNIHNAVFSTACLSRRTFSRIRTRIRIHPTPKTQTRRAKERRRERRR